MYLNLNECSIIIIISLKRLLIKFNYVLGNVNLLKENTISDLRIVYDSKLSFNEHINFISNKATVQL